MITAALRQYIPIPPYTIEPLSNDHPHQRPFLLYDHISCDGQCFLFVRSLTDDHPSNATNDRVAKFVFATSSHAVIIYFGRLGLRGRIRVIFVAMVRVSKLLGSNNNPNPIGMNRSVREGKKCKALWTVQRTGYCAIKNTFLPLGLYAKILILNVNVNSTGKLGRFLVEPGHLEQQAETFRICWGGLSD